MAHLRNALLLLLATCAACAAPEPTLLPEVEYAGCEAVLVPGPVCLPKPDRKLNLWVEAAQDEEVEIRIDGKRIDAAAERIGNGQGFSLALPARAAKLDVLVAARQEPVLSLSLTRPEARSPMPRNVLREVNDLTLGVYESIRKRELAAARKALTGLQLPPKSPAESRMLVSYSWSLLADREGDYRRALAELQKTMEIAERARLDFEKRLAEEQLALVLRGVGRSREAAAVFALLRSTLPPADAGSCEAGRLLNNQAWSMLLAGEAGESLGDPTPLLEQALTAYETCKKFKFERKVNVLINLVLAHLQAGRLAQAKDLLAHVHRLDPRASLPHTLWRLDLEARIELQEGRPSQALHLYEELERLAEEAASPESRLRGAFGQAQSHQARGDLEATLATLRRVEDLLDEQSLQIPIDQGRETFVATRQAASGLHIEVLLDRGQKEQALAVMRHARSRIVLQLKSSGRLASLPPDRKEQWERFLKAYQEIRSSLEERAKDDWKLSDAQRERERASRKAQAETAQRFLDQAFLVLEEAGEQAEEGPMPPRPGELILAYHPLSHGRWVGFAADGKTVAAHRFELPPAMPSRPTRELGRLLLHPFRAEIRKADRIRFLPSGPLQDVDFHALPFDGEILLASSPVVYGLDLPVSEGSERAPERRALVVMDSRDDLPGALEEGRKIFKALRSGPRPWHAEELKGEEASADTVRGQLTAADLLHYAGHSSYSGFGGWESSLLLADNSELTLRDLLTLDRVPTWVVLSGCESGRSSTEVPVEGLGLAQAFVLAGSKGVVASIRPAYDRAVPELFTELYRQWDREPDLALALQRAQLHWRRRNPGADWAGFRLFEP